MARRRRKKSGASAGAVLAAIALGLFIVGASGGLFYLWGKAGANALDDDLCPLTGGPTSVTAVLLDVTDPISEITKVDLKRNFQRAVSGVERGGLVEVYSLTDEAGTLQRTYRGCNPGDGASADQLTSNPKRIQQRWETAFNKPLKDIKEQIGSGVEGKQSPIMAGIQRIVIESFSDMRNEEKPKLLIVASDMIEHTPSFSIYKSSTDYSAFEKSDAKERFRTPLDGIQFKVLAFQRENASALAQLPEFWLQWVQSNGGEWGGYERLAGIK